MKIPSEPFVILDRSLPIYRQIYESIRQNILEGRTAPGSRLPPSRQMAENLGVSRMT
ncbi:MAG: winged helix-turn-helix domain-containing protein, partial [Acidobacteriota bacterium]